MEVFHIIIITLKCYENTKILVQIILEMEVIIFILNTGTCGIIRKSLHTSPNYSNTYNINYNSYPSPFRSNSGTYNEGFLLASYNVLASNKIKLTYYFKYGTWFYGNNQNSFEGFYTFKITTFYEKYMKIVV